MTDPRFVLDDGFAGGNAAESSDARPPTDGGDDYGTDSEGEDNEEDAAGKTVQPLTREELAATQAAAARTGVIYISRIPPGMQPAKVKFLMQQYGEVGRVYLQREGTSRHSPI